MTSDSDRMRAGHPFTQVAHNLLSYSFYLSSTALCKVVDHLNAFLRDHNNALTKNDDTYLARQIISISGCLHSAFYLIIKRHKNHWATHPIVSQYGSITYGISRWANK
jgi:hypothetical protein